MASVSTRAAAICRPPLCTAPRLLERVITGRMQLAERYRHDEVCNTRWLWMVISAQINTHRRLKSSLAAQDLRLRGSSGFLLQPPMRVNLAKQPYGHPDVSLSSRALIQEILQAVNTPFDGLAANVQEDLRHALRTASVLAGVRRFAPALGITERPGLDDSVTVQRGLIPGWDTPVQSERPPFSQADWDRVEAHVRRRDRARQWRRYNRWIGEDSIAEEEHAEEIAELNARQWRRRNQSDQDSIAEEEHAEDVAELTEMYLGQQVQITRAGRSQLRQLGYPVRSNGILRVRRLDDDE
ncbi:hypothetical protein D0862_11927 [Hortaea werneckii]|uniref:Uncharacterized protein n=1 Tax=Hortaea werneckii TaxID=91943 RepID=A0A3M7F1Q5_HORWE|nr:hypothetical protein D0862_11927 [Hortaea werneckii]